MKTMLALFIALASLPAYGDALKKAPTSGATVEKVLAFYHTEDFLDDCLKHIEDAVERRQKEVTIEDATARRIKDVAARIYVKKNLYDVFKVAYAKQTTLENMTALWDWMNSPRGLMLRRAYNDHYKGKASFKDWKAFYDKDSKTLLKPNRKNAITTFVTATEQWELGTTKVLGSDFAVWWTTNQLSPQKETLSYIKGKIKIRKPGYIEPAREYFMIYDFALLRALKNEDIDEISKFSSTVIGQGAAKAYRAALEQTLESAAKTLASEIGKGTK